MFTDDPELDCQGWEKFIVEPKPDQKLFSRELKLLVHKWIDADLYIYMDANYEIKHDLGGLISTCFWGGFTAVRHPTRGCITQEADKIVELGKSPERRVAKQVEQYKSEGMPDLFGLFANGFFIRDQSFNRFFELWYQELEKHCYRDQLSLPYLIWKHEPKVTVIPWGMKDHWLKLHFHKNGSIQPITPKIWYFVPGAGDKNLGKVLNDHCALVPNDDDWILVRDNDTCFLSPYINKQVEDIIQKHGESYQLLSCYTNRLGLPWQLPHGLMDETNIITLKKLADKYFDDHYDEVIEAEKPTAGLFMLFQKKTWKRLKFEQGLRSAGKFIDWHFADGIKRMGGKIGICKGIFLYHFYRADKDAKDISHLL